MLSGSSDSQKNQNQEVSEPPKGNGFGWKWMGITALSSIAAAVGTSAVIVWHEDGRKKEAADIQHQEEEKYQAAMVDATDCLRDERGYFLDVALSREKNTVVQKEFESIMATCRQQIENAHRSNPGKEGIERVMECMNTKWFPLRSMISSESELQIQPGRPLRKIEGMVDECRNEAWNYRDLFLYKMHKKENRDKDFNERR